MLLSPILLLGFQLIFFFFSFFSASFVVICDGIDTGQDQTILVTFFLWSYNVCRQSWSLVSSRKFKCKEWDREFTKLHNFPPQCSPTHAGRIKRQYHKWQCEQHEERKVLTPHERQFENDEEVEEPIWQKIIWESWGREPLLWIFHPRLCPRKLSRRLFKEMLMRSTRAPAQKNL